MSGLVQRLGSRRPSASMVVALLALAIALGGTAFAAPKKKFGSVKKATVVKIAKREARAILKKSAAGLSVANAAQAANAAHAATATSASNAGALGGQPASAYAQAQSEPYRVVGAPGEPPFESGWSGFSSSSDSFAPVAFYKDPIGVIHLRGAVASKTESLNNTPAFTLPPGYRPSAVLVFPTSGTGEPEGVFVFADGQVVLDCHSVFCTRMLDGITFRAEQ